MAHSANTVFLLVLVVLCGYDATAYRHRWALLSGDLSTVSKAPVFGPKGGSSPNFGPGSLHGAATAMDSINGDLWLHGGYNNGYYDNLWKYRLNDSSWTWVSGSGPTANQNGIFGTKGVPNATNKPPSLYGAAMWFDSTLSALWLFGGQQSSSSHYNTLWRFTTNDSTWTWMGGNDSANAVGVYVARGVPDTNNIPTARFQPSIVFLRENRTMYLMGGLFFDGTYHNSYNDLWRFRHNDSTWTWLAGPSTSNDLGNYGTKGIASASNLPRARYKSAMWLEQDGQYLRMFGGVSIILFAYYNYNDMWLFNMSSNLWTWVGGSNIFDDTGRYGTLALPATTNNPPSRAFSSFWSDETANERWLFGGEKYYGVYEFYNDLWRYRLNDSMWTWMGGSNVSGSVGSLVAGVLQANTANIPRSSSQIMTWSDSRANVWMYGGYSGASINSFWYLGKYVQCEEYVNQTNPAVCSGFVDNNTITIQITNKSAELPPNEQQCLIIELQTAPIVACGSASCVRPGSCDLTPVNQITLASFCHLNQSSAACVAPRICDGNGTCLMNHGGPCASGSDCISNICERPNLCCKTNCTADQECNAQGDCKSKSGVSCTQGSDCWSGLCSSSNICCASSDTWCDTLCVAPAPPGNVSCVNGRWIVYTDAASVLGTTITIVTFPANTTLVITDPFIAPNVTILVPIVGGITSSAGRLEVRNCVVLGGQVRIQAASSNSSIVQGGQKILILSSNHPECFNIANVTTIIEGFVGPQDSQTGCTQTVSASSSVEVQLNLVSLFAVVEVSGCEPAAPSPSAAVPVGLVAGVVVGVIVFALILTVVTFFVRLRREHAKEKRTIQQVMHSKLERATVDHVSSASAQNNQL